MSFVACTLDAAFAAQHREALEALVTPVPESGVVLLQREKPSALAVTAQQGEWLHVTHVFGADVRALGTELRHRAALAGLQGVKCAPTIAAQLGFSADSAPAEKLERVIAIHQPNYLPWCGYFAKMKTADVFVFLDDVPMPGGSSYVNRTRVGGNAPESQWLSVPTRHSLEEPLHRAVLADKKFGKTHVGTLRARYGRTAHFKPLIEKLEPIYLSAGERLADFNVRCLEVLCETLSLSGPRVRSAALPTSSSSGDRLVELVKRLGGTRYLSGKGGQNYQSEEAFRAAGIVLDVRAHTPIPYAQGKAEFEPGLSVIDALAHVGPEATRALLVLP